MPTITTGALREQIASGTVGPLYVLLGADDAEKAAMAAEFGELIDEGLRAFNVDRLYGGEVKVDRLIDIAMTLPMMVPRRVIIVMEAEKLLIPKRESKASEEELERFIAFVRAPPRETTVVFICGLVDRRRRAFKALLDEAKVVDCGTIEDAGAAERWVRARATREGVTLEPAAVRALVARAGLNIVRLRAGLERVALYALGQAVVTEQDVQQTVVAGPQAQEDFGISNAIGARDPRRALGQLQAALDAGAPPYFVLGQVRSAAEKLPSPVVRAGIDAVFRTDVALKSSMGDPRMLLERLVVELCSLTGGRRASW